MHRLVKLLGMTVCDGWHQMADPSLFVLLLWWEENASLQSGLNGIIHKVHFHLSFPFSSVV